MKSQASCEGLAFFQAFQQIRIVDFMLPQEKLL